MCLRKLDITELEDEQKAIGGVTEMTSSYENHHGK